MTLPDQSVEGENRRLREALRQLDHLLSSPGDMSRDEIRAEGVRLTRSALDEAQR